MVWWYRSKDFIIQTEGTQLTKGGKKSRKSDKVLRCSSKSSSKHNSKFSAKSSFSSKSQSSTKARAIEEKVKAAELMMEASFMKK